MRRVLHREMAVAKITSRESKDIFEMIGRASSIKQASSALKAMSHPVRYKILCLLAAEEMSVLDIVDAVGATQSNVSQHLSILRQYHVLTTRREKNKVFYRIADSRIVKMLGLTREIFCRR